MSMACVRGGRECDGCGACQSEPQSLDVCAACGEPVFAWEDRYDIEGEIIHSDCLSEWAEKYKVDV